MARPGSTRTRAARLSIASNTSLIALKLAAGLITGSVGILSDAVHSLMDLVASVVSFLSVRKAEEPADATHRFGHEKLEDLSASGQGILLLLGAAFIAIQAVRRLSQGGTVTSPAIAMVVAGFAATVNVVVSRYLNVTGRRTGSASLEATGADLWTDALVSLGVLLALGLYKLTGWRWIDPVVGLVVAVAIAATGARVLSGASRRLADETLPEDELASLKAVADAFLGDEVVGYHDLRARHVGRAHQVDLHLQFADGTSLRRAHEISHQLQDAMTRRLPGTTVLVHLEPEERVRADRFS